MINNQLSKSMSEGIWELSKIRLGRIRVSGKDELEAPEIVLSTDGGLPSLINRTEKFAHRAGEAIREPGAGQFEGLPFFSLAELVGAELKIDRRQGVAFDHAGGSFDEETGGGGVVRMRGVVVDQDGEEAAGELQLDAGDHLAPRGLIGLAAQGGADF